MLARAGLCNDAALLHAQAQQRLPQGIVDLVSACVVQVLALEVDLWPRTIRAASTTCADVDREKVNMDVIVLPCKSKQKQVPYMHKNIFTSPVYYRLYRSDKRSAW